MFAETLDDLKLSEEGKIGYTYKTLGAGFWALRQNNFRRALTEIVMEVCTKFTRMLFISIFDICMSSSTNDIFHSAFKQKLSSVWNESANIIRK